MWLADAIIHSNNPNLKPAEPLFFAGVALIIWLIGRGLKYILAGRASGERAIGKEWFMFGMLDYRAHKLYRVLVYPVGFVLSLFNLFGLPIIAYLSAIKFASQPVLQILLGFVVLFLIGIPWFFIAKMIIAVPLGIFNFLIDPEPAEGRTKEEAKLVVASGDKAILLLKLNRPASEWTDEDIDALATLTLATSLFFESTVRRRVHEIREYYLDNPDVVQSEYTTNRFLKEAKLSIGWLETVITNPFVRGIVVQYSVLLIIFLALSH